ncbi:hypothetical protein ACN47E_005857 [Coniothyrium glycines]
MADYRIGQTVETSTGQQGLVKYVGTIHVAEGIWLGVQLDEPAGKNDGSVRGERYFTCPPAHGLFVKPTSIVQILAQPAPATPTPAPASKATAPKTRPAAPTSRPRPSSVVAPKPAPRTSTINKRQSLAPGTAYAPTRAPIRKPSIAGSSVTSPSEPAESSRRPAASRPSISSTTSTTTTSRAARDNNVETLQTKIRHLEKQHSEDQEKLKDLAQVRDERDRFHTIVGKLQTKTKDQFDEIKSMKAQMQDLQYENDALRKAHDEFEVENEHALIDKEMAEERADQAEAEVELLRRKIEERDLELDILREEAELYTAEMSEEQKQDAGYYRLQHENDRLRQALIGLKEMTEEREQDLKATVSSLESDLAMSETLKGDNVILQQRVVDAEALAEDLKQRLEAAEEADDMIEELSTQNQNLQDRVAEQDLIIQDLENLRELNDELEIQHLEQEEDMRAELEAKDTELVDQLHIINEQTSTIADQETLISKFRDLVIDLQAKMTNAEDSKTMTEAQAKDTTGRFNEVMDINRQLRAATVQSTSREIDSQLMQIKHAELHEKLDIWEETQSKDFVHSDPFNAFITAKRMFSKAQLLINMLHSANKQMSSGGRLEDALSSLICWEATSNLAVLRDHSDRLFRAIRSSTLQEFANFGPLYQELITIENIIDQGLNALKADTVNFEELAGSVGRSIKIYEAILANQHHVLAEKPEDDFMYKVETISTRLQFIDALYTSTSVALQIAPQSISDLCVQVQGQLKAPLDKTKGALAAIISLKKTLYGLREDSMYPQPHFTLEGVTMQEEMLTRMAERVFSFARKLVEELIKCTTMPDDELMLMSGFDIVKQQIGLLESDHQSSFGASGIAGLSTLIRDWTDHVSILMNNVEIEQKPAPWSLKAKEVEAARKKDEEVARQLQTLTSEHIATVLKINEREQVISTKELEIEHLMAKNRDVTAKMGDVEALKAEVKERGDKIAALKAEGRALTQEIQALKERGTFSDRSIKDETEALTANTPAAGADAIEQATLQSTPIGLKILLEALQNENHWLRQREQKAILECNQELFNAWLPKQHQLPDAHFEKMLEMILDSTMLSDDDEEVEALTPNGSSPTHGHLTPLALRQVQLGWQSRSESLKEALELAEESMFSTIYEDDEMSYISIHS